MKDCFCICIGGNLQLFDLIIGGKRVVFVSGEVEDRVALPALCLLLCVRLGGKNACVDGLGSILCSSHLCVR